MEFFHFQSSGQVPLIPSPNPSAPSQKMREKGAPNSKPFLWWDAQLPLLLEMLLPLYMLVFIPGLWHRFLSGILAFDWTPSSSEVAVEAPSFSESVVNSHT